MAEITTSQTMGNKTITTTINTAARGPQGEPGTDANVTQANIEAAITDKPGFREEIGTQSASIGYLDQFDNSTRYPDPTSIVSNTTTPEVGNAWRIHVPSGTAPTVTGRALTPHIDSLFYIGSSVPSPGRKFSLGFEFTAATGSASWINRLGLNISFNAAEMIAADGSGIFPSAGGGVVHINFSDTGVSTAASPQFFGGASLTCLNASLESGTYPWRPGYPGMAADQRYTMLFEVDGDYLRITLVGVGSLLFYHPDLSDHVGTETTNFWWETAGATYGTDYRLVPKLHRVWSGESLDQNPAFGSRPPASMLTQLNTSYAGNIVLGTTNNSIPTNSKLAVGATGSSTSRGFLRPFGGAIYTESPIIRQVGNFAVGGSLLGVAPHVAIPSSHITAPIVNATTGSEVTLRQLPIQLGLENGDSQEWNIYGNFTAAAAGRRIIVKDSVYGNVVYNSNASGTPLDAFASGTPWHLKIFNPVLSAANFTVYATLYAGGTLIGMGRISGEYGTINYLLNINIVQATTNSISIEGIVHTVNRVVVPTS